jgi:Polysaccharide deacetylase
MLTKIKVNIVPSTYPALDKTPPTNSPEVLQWIQDVKNSGITIPTFTPTVAGGCPTNAQAAADTTRCWWTCGGCTRDTDVTTCPDKLTWGLTYDDGPSTYTPNLVNYLNSVNVQGTFFVVGSRVISNPATLQAQYMTGHQVWLFLVPILNSNSTFPDCHPHLESLCSDHPYQRTNHC